MKSNHQYLGIQIEEMQAQIERLEHQLASIEAKIERQISLMRSHMVRLKNDEMMTDDFIFNSRPYMDLSPERAYEIYQDRDFNFILVDVSVKGFSNKADLPEALCIPFEELPNRFHEIASLTTPILVISEDGTRSVLACEFLVKHGYFNTSNISGGHRHWPGKRIPSQSQSA